MVEIGVHMSEVKFYVWQGDDIQANVLAEYKTGSGGTTFGVVGKLPIKNGDIVSLNYGAMVQVYTRSGKGYENSSKHGIMSRMGDGATIELDAQTAIFIKSDTNSKEAFDTLVQKQKEQSSSYIAKLVVQHELDVKIKFDQNVIQNKKNEIQRKEIVKSAVDKMEEFFAPKKSKP